MSTTDDTRQRSVAELMWTSEPCCNVVDGNGHCPDDCRIWTSPDGSDREYGRTPGVTPTPDVMLSWLREQGYAIDVGESAGDWIILSVRHRSPASTWRDLSPASTWREFPAPTLFDAFEAAVRAVAEVSGDE